MENDIEVITNHTNFESRENDSNRKNSFEEFSQPYALLGAMNENNDLKLKITKLEAYSRQLCLNLKDLQKNREYITNKTLALSEELECPGVNEDDVASEPDIHVLHAQKNGCCTICKGNEDRECNYSKHATRREEIERVREPLKIFSLENLDASECSCCVCCENRISHEYYCDECNGRHLTFISNGLTNISSIFERMPRVRQMCQGDCKLRCICGNIDESSIDKHSNICGCEQEDMAEASCRGGVDFLETPQRFNDVSSCVSEDKNFTIDASKSFGAHYVRESSSSSSHCIREDGADSGQQKLQLYFPERDTSKIPNDNQPVKFPEFPNLNENNVSSDYGMEDDCRVKTNGIDHAELLRYLAVMADTPREEIRKVISSKEERTSKSDLLVGLLVLSLVLLSHTFSHFALSPLSNHLKNIFQNLLDIFHRINLKPENLITELMTLIYTFNGNFTSFSIIFGNMNTVWNYLALIEAVSGMIFIAKSMQASAKTFDKRQNKDSYASRTYLTFVKCYESIKRSTKEIILCTKSQYYFFSYVLWLTLGFLLGKASRLVDKWFSVSMTFLNNNLLIKSEIVK